jgi:antitoxin component of MazEF toxin-antitoxin module
MIKKLQKIGNSRGIVIDSSFLKLLNIDKDGAMDVELTQDGLLLKPVSVKDAYKKVSQKYRKSLNKLGE